MAQRENLSPAELECIADRRNERVLQPGESIKSVFWYKSLEIRDTEAALDVAAWMFELGLEVGKSSHLRIARLVSCDICRSLLAVIDANVNP